MKLPAARAKAAEWYGLVRQGIDPKDAEAEKASAADAARRAAALADATTFASVAERFISEHVAKQRRGGPGAREFGTPQRDKDGKLRYLTCYDDHGNPVYGKAPKPASFLSTIKKKRQRGRRELQEVREALARRDAYFKKLRMNSRGRK